MEKLLIMLGLGVLILGCTNIGGSNNSTISASANNYCSPITSSNQCFITLTYDSNGNSGLALGVNYNPQQLSQFTLVNYPASCPTPSSSGGSQTCQVQVTYLSTGSSVSESLVFTLGSAGSNSVDISGN